MTENFKQCHDENHLESVSSDWLDLAVTAGETGIVRGFNVTWFQSIYAATHLVFAAWTERVTVHLVQV